MKLDKDTLVYIIENTERMIEQEQSLADKWNTMDIDTKTRIRTLEEMLKWLKYLQDLSKEI